MAPPDRALYGRGLLRFCSENLYGRVMANVETPSSREAVLSIGRAITAKREITPEPGLLKILAPSIGDNWRLKRDRIGYFRSYLVLNSLYYISHENILGFNLSTEAISAVYEKAGQTGKPQRVQFLFVNYADQGEAGRALQGFLEAYLPEYKGDLAGISGQKISNTYKIEDGWMGYDLRGRGIAMVFECPERNTVGKLLDGILWPK
jgi:hypothetical protein